LERVEKENFMDGIKDKIVVITGASSGIGEAT
jgi:NADP-dependent 3-hydroxy acid dehydrogenase YdfG